MSAYKTAAGEAEAVYVVERSKFICLIRGIDAEADAKELIAYAKKKYPLATHYCYAYIADEKGLSRKFSDDGEPHGTAGLPILNALTGAGLVKTAAVVVRYFGGIKLGTGGLSRAYLNATAEALKLADIKEYCEAEFLSAALTYAQYKKFQPFCGAALVSTEFGGEVRLSIAVKAERAAEFKAKFYETIGTGATLIKNGTGYYSF